MKKTVNKELIGEFAEALGCKTKAVPIRMDALGHSHTCGRCGGGGQYSWNGTHSRCYDCNGVGRVMAKLTEALLIKVHQEVKDGYLNPYLEKLRKRDLARKLVNDFFEAWRALPGQVETRKLQEEQDKKGWRWHTEQQGWENGYCSTLHDAIQKLDTHNMHQEVVDRVHQIASMLLRAESLIPKDLSHELRDDYSLNAQNAGRDEAKRQLEAH